MTEDGSEDEGDAGRSGGRGRQGRRWSRRGLIAGAAAAGIGAAAGAVTGAVPASAGTQGGDMTLGEGNTATDPTTLLSSATATFHSTQTASTGLDNSLSGAIFGESTTGFGIIGLASGEGQVAVYGQSSGGSASSIQGVTGVNDNDGVFGLDYSSGGGVGVAGESDNGLGVQGESSNGIGVSAQGGRAPLYLVPATSTGPPTTGLHDRGEVVVDSEGDIYVCTYLGEPGAWGLVSVGPTSYASGAFCLLPAPIRLLDTRPSSGAPTDPGTPLVKGGTLDLLVAGVTVGGIFVPEGAVAVIGNVTAVNAEAHGYLTLWATGVSQPGTSSLNFPLRLR